MHHHHSTGGSGRLPGPGCRAGGAAAVPPPGRDGSRAGDAAGGAIRPPGPRPAGRNSSRGLRSLSALCLPDEGRAAILSVKFLGLGPASLPSPLSLLLPPTALSRGHEPRAASPVTQLAVATRSSRVSPVSLTHPTTPNTRRRVPGRGAGRPPRDALPGGAFRGGGGRGRGAKRRRAWGRWCVC